MAPRQQDKADRLDRNPLFATALLQSLGVLTLIATSAGVVIVLALRVRQEHPIDIAFVAWIIGSFVAGVTLGGLLIGLAALVRCGYTLARSHDMDIEYDCDAEWLGGGSCSWAAGEPNSEAACCSNQGFSAMTSILRSWHEIDDLSLLSSEERAEARDRVLSRLQRNVAEEIIDAVNARQLGRARLMLQDAEACFGPAPTLQKLEERIEQAATRNEPLDYTRGKRLIEEAIDDDRWAVAERYAHALTFDHPDSGRCKQMRDDTRRARLHSQIEHRAEQHDWAEGLAAAEEFLERFPDSPEAETLREQMPTLRANAEILQRKQYEARFTKLLGTHQYADALRIAKLVVDRYPDSPQAHALRDQIPLLEKRVAG